MNPGDRVMLYGPNCWDWLVAYYGIAKTGAVVNPLSVMLTAEEVRDVAEDSGARAVIASPDKGEPLLDMRGTADLADVVLWGEETTVGATAFADWLWQAKPNFTPVPRDGGRSRGDLYTSGPPRIPRAPCRAIAR